MDDVEFYDLHQGDMLLREWHGVPWLFIKGAENQWVSFRKADEDDLYRLRDFIKDEERNLWQRESGPLPKV
ncbi:hypothetical protein LCGC14_0353790 [marine sediment metagenome]|uniref:Uncharacterized protein n=1 Tax=marine sediment metagenome TaxID=412755 RepID=A0A0F9TT65_9ZZZZ